eukprot:766967-Hanusia_phi.AAC.2
MSTNLRDDSLSQTEWIPQRWLENERRILDRQGIIAILHPEPACVGHCIIFSKQPTPSLERFDRDQISAIGMILPEIKRALRLTTAYSSFGVFLRSGQGNGQDNNQVYFEVIPTSKANPTFQINWRSEMNVFTMKEKILSPAQATNLISTLRRSMMLHSHQTEGNLLYETDRVICELHPNPSSTGHICIGPRRLSPDLEDCEVLDMAECLWVMPLLANACVKSITAKDFLLILLDGPDCGQSSPHLVWHFIPFSSRKLSVTVEVKHNSRSFKKACQLEQRDCLPLPKSQLGRASLSGNQLMAMESQVPMQAGLEQSRFGTGALQLVVEVPLYDRVHRNLGNDFNSTLLSESQVGLRYESRVNVNTFFSKSAEHIMRSTPQPREQSAGLQSYSKEHTYSVRDKRDIVDEILKNLNG